MSAALDGLRVLDLSRSLTGPLCSMMLADLGAEVIKVELPGIGDDTRYWGPPFVGDAGPTFLAYNRRKKSVELDLRDAGHREQVLELVRSSDILVENFRPGTMARYGLSYDELTKVRSDLIYCSISGFGQTGEDAHRPAMDLLVQARSGIMSLTGPIDGGAFKAAAPVADVTAGLIASSSILASVIERQRTGAGAYLDISMLDAMCVLLGQPIAAYAMSGKTPRRWGNEHALMAPYQSFETAGREIVIAVTNDKTWERMCRIPDFEDLADDPILAGAPGRSARRVELNAEIARRLRRRDHRYWLEKFEGVGVPIELVWAVPDLIESDSLRRRGALVEVEYPAGSGHRFVVPGSPWSAADPTRDPGTPPSLGEHTEEVLGDLPGQQ
ncbi:CoA transferase [Microbacterium pseudoresistens]|uniref:Crotonobetainyl-CoA:carnitine CoA-transferase CaiB-like acyl-CoA transferase n=1 Tax=Microbacterium pseudoresistens TaxID=640634 RepID=A0A7Y9EVB8_9MICO|nr:CaiB/BaiF CoA-transferase family protein [Microbacterium pseudoresistens]NYD54615.1 crotonobetainyl-CoA:carnitine CoA-transferase CaiB-like acyl-CoA transferase [Microbacterium pseudoresistens]